MTDTVASPFANALGNLFDKTNYFSREEWARFLGVEVSTISDWTSDKALPVSHSLDMVVTVLRNRAGIPEEPLKEFDELSKLPAVNVSPMGRFMSPTVEKYMETSLFQWIKILGSLDPDHQVKVLKGSWYPETIDLVLSI